jgi:hypothetical protein
MVRCGSGVRCGGIGLVLMVYDLTELIGGRGRPGALRTGFFAAAGGFARFTFVTRANLYVLFCVLEVRLGIDGDKPGARDGALRAVGVGDSGGQAQGLHPSVIHRNV